MNFFAGGICTGFVDCGMVTFYYFLPALPVILLLYYLLYRYVRHMYEKKDAIEFRVAVSYILLANAFTFAAILLIDYPEAIALPLFVALNLLALTMIYAQSSKKQD